MSNGAATSGVNMESMQQQQQQERKQKRRRRQQPRDDETKKKIAKISDAIRKKYMSLKLGKMATKAAAEESARPIVEPLKHLVENTATLKTIPAIPSLVKRKQQQQQQQHRLKKKRLSFTPSTAEATIRPETTPLPDSNDDDDDDDDDDDSADYETTEEHDHGETDETIREVLDPKTPTTTTTTTVYNLDAYTRNASGPLSREYLHLFFTDTKRLIDNVYGVYLSDDEQLMIGDSVLTIGENDDVSVKGQRYAGTRGLYELLFMRVPNEQAYTSDDLDAYRDILLSTNAHRRDHSASKPTLGNKGYKYRKIVSVLISGDRNVGGITHEGRGLPIDYDGAMTVTDNAIDYVYWDDPNELVDRLRLLVASRDAGHTGHDNEIASIVEELREAGLIVN